MSRSCSQCGNNGHNARTCGGSGGFMAFGVRVTEDSIRKSVSMNNLSQYEQSYEPNADDPSNDIIHTSAGNRERKRGVPLTEEEHRLHSLFLLGLQKVGKGDWRSISRNFVKTRTPTQVAIHAQKYFIRRNKLKRRRRRSSFFVEGISGDDDGDGSGGGGGRGGDSSGGGKMRKKDDEGGDGKGAGGGKGGKKKAAGVTDCSYVQGNVPHYMYLPALLLASG